MCTCAPAALASRQPAVWTARQAVRLCKTGTECYCKKVRCDMRRRARVEKSAPFVLVVYVFGTVMFCTSWLHRRLSPRRASAVVHRCCCCPQHPQLPAPPCLCPQAHWPPKRASPPIHASCAKHTRQTHAGATAAPARPRRHNQAASRHRALIAYAMEQKGLRPAAAGRAALPPATRPSLTSLRESATAAA